MQYGLYKQLRLRQEERARLANYWMRQERLKRQLDVGMSAARAELAALPSHIPLPHEFLSHLNALIATPSKCLHTAADSQHTSYASSYASGYMHTCPGAPTPLPQPITSAFGPPRSSTAHTAHSLPDFNTGFHRPAMHSFSPMQPASGWPLPHTRDPDAVWDPMMSGKLNPPFSQYSPFSSCALLNHHHSDPQPFHVPDAVRFMGQHPEDIARAERMLGGLRYVMEAVKDLHVDHLNAEMPGVLLEVEKCHMLRSDLFLSHKVPVDFLEVCQIAATQQNRCSLFQDPFW